MKAVHESLRQRAEELDRLVQAMPAYVWIALDPECRQIIGNDLANELLGVGFGTNTSQSVAVEGLAPRLEQYDRSGNEIAPEDLPIQRALSTRQPVRDAEFQIVARDGRRVWLRGNAVPLFEADGVTVRGAIASFVDITPLEDAARALRARDERLQLAQQGARVGFWDWTPETGDLEWSAGNEHIYGAPPGSIRTYADWRRFVHPDDIARVEQQAARMLAGETHEFEFRIIRDDGSQRWVHTRGGPIRDARGATVRMAGINLDITERKVAEEGLVRARMAIDAARLADLGVHDCDLRTGIITADAKVRDIFGLAPGEEFTFDRFLASIHPSDSDAVQQSMQAAFDPHGPGVVLVEYRVKRPARPTRWVLATGIVQFDDGEPVRLVGTAQDVTARRRDAELLREADRRKTEFLAVLSHELRNPLAPLANSLVLIENSPSGSVAMARALQVARRQFGHLKRLVDDLLDVNRIVSGKIRLQSEPLDLALLVRRVLDDHRTLFDQHGIALEANLGDEHPWVDGDDARLAQSLGNLLQNACKFTDRGGRVAVGVRPEGDAARVSVEDNGVGMDEDALARAFEPFAQSERTMARTSGLGLGLALVKGIVVQHGGSVSVSSAGVGHGTRFEISLPRIEAPVTAVAAASAGSTATKRRILVVEDNEDSAVTMQALLELLGHEATVALTGSEALAAFEHYGPDVVVCDIGLPDLTGYEVASRIRQRANGRRVLLVALSGFGMEEDRRRAEQAGFDAHLTKPADVDRLETLLRAQ